MKTEVSREYTTYPRQFVTYKWFKPLLVALIFAVLYVLSAFLITFLTRVLFGTTVSSQGYDDMDFYSAAGAFSNGAGAAVYIPCILLAALIVRDRPISSYFSCMGGWRWKSFLKSLLAAFIIIGIPTAVWYFTRGRVSDIRFTLGGFILLSLFIPLQGIGEELIYRGYFMQTVASWFMLPVVGVLAQTLIFSVVHPYNIVGITEIAVSALLYALACILSRGLEAPSAIHIANNVSEIFMAGFGFGIITAEQTVPDVALNLALKVVFCLFILYASKKLHWFDELKYDDVEAFNAKRQ